MVKIYGGDKHSKGNQMTVVTTEKKALELCEFARMVLMEWTNGHPDNRTNCIAMINDLLKD